MSPVRTRKDLLGKEGGKHCPVLHHYIQGTTKPAVDGLLTIMKPIEYCRPRRTPRTNLVFLSGFWS
uniref:Uncharacterized protein n=1 Tax=Buteo japonicus TaxID=224669 RepID=A0A8B9Z5W5_9AVES